MRAALGRLVRGVLAASVANIRTTVNGSVGVEDFAIVARPWNAKSIALANDGSCIDDRNDQIFRVFAAANEAQDAIVGVIGVNPFETVPIEVDLMECRLGNVDAIQIGD